MIPLGILSAATPRGGIPPEPSDPYWVNYSSLLHFDGADASTSFIDEIGDSWAAIVNAQIDTGQFKFGSSSLQLSTGAITAANSSSFSFSGGPFTVEAWIRPVSVTSIRAIVSQRNSSGGAGWVFWVRDTAKLGFAYANGAGGWVDAIGSTSIVPDVWTHVAVCYDGTTLRLFVNGVVDATISTFTGTAIDSTDVRYIGRDRVGNNSRDWNGHIDELRVTKGEALYTEDFEVATEAFPNPRTVSLMHFNGADGSTTFTDQKGRVWGRAGNAAISTDQAKFGGASLELDGNGDYIGTDAGPEDFNLGSGDWTLEGWVYLRGYKTAFQPMFMRDAQDAASSSRGYGLRIFPSTDADPNTLGLLAFVGTTANQIKDTTPFPTGQWVHVAGVRDGSTLRLFRDGAQVASAAISGSLNATSWLPRIGVMTNADNTPTVGNHYFDGYLDEWRITKGVARYTANFTPPTAPFPDS